MRYWNDNLKRILQRGNKIEIFFYEGNSNNKTIEIRGVVDDNYIVYRVYRKAKQRFCYGLEHISYYGFLEEDGCLELVHKGVDTNNENESK